MSAIPVLLIFSVPLLVGPLEDESLQYGTREDQETRPA